jgi:hypothetical protein
MVTEAIAEHHGYFRLSPTEFLHAKSFHNPVKYLTTGDTNLSQTIR